MSESVSEVRQKIAALESEREELLKSIERLKKPLTKKEKGADKRVTQQLVVAKKNLEMLKRDLVALDKAHADARLPLSLAWPLYVQRAAFIGFLLTPIPLAVSYLRASDDVRWVGTTCELREVEGADDSSAWVLSPALRPEWTFSSDQDRNGRCWIPEPATDRQFGVFVEPKDDRVPKWLQVTVAARALSSALLLFSFLGWASSLLSLRRVSL